MDRGSENEREHSPQASEAQSGSFQPESVREQDDQVIEMEIDDSDIYAVIVDEDDNEIGFVLIDESGQEQEFYYGEDPDGEGAGTEGDGPARTACTPDDEELDLGITREVVTEAADDLNAIYKDGAEVIAELKDTFTGIGESFDFLKKK